MKTAKMLPLVASLLLLAVTPVLAGPDDDPGTVTNYAINWVVQTGVNEITAQVQANYCTACNPNSANNSGCPAFAHGYNPNATSAYYYSCGPRIAGRYIAVRVKDSAGVVLGTQKLVLNPSNWPLGSVVVRDFVFSGLALTAGDTVKVEVDTYCSYCRHWYPAPRSTTVQAANSQVTYTGDTSALVGTSANVSATLVDAGPGNPPLSGRTITFTLNPSAPIATVTAVTNALGVAATTMAIPAATAAGTYTMNTRFAGDASYFPCSDQVPFTVIVNRPPVADAGPDRTVEQDSYDGASVTLDGSGSSDPDNDPLTYDWTWPGGSASGVSPTVTLPLGTTTVTLTVSDGQASDTDTVDITVVDTTPPTINDISASPDVLWPPNHKMVEVTVTVDCEDICDPAPVCLIVGVTSNEPINGLGDGNTDPDWEITGDLTVDLRAERAGGGTGRVYTITVECTDASNNTTTATVDVIVPHDQGKGKK